MAHLYPPMATNDSVVGDDREVIFLKFRLTKHRVECPAQYGRLFLLSQEELARIKNLSWILLSLKRCRP